MHSLPAYYEWQYLWGNKRVQILGRHQYPEWCPNGTSCTITHISNRDGSWLYGMHGISEQYIYYPKDISSYSWGNVPFILQWDRILHKFCCWICICIMADRISAADTWIFRYWAHMFGEVEKHKLRRNRSACVVLLWLCRVTTHRYLVSWITYWYTNQSFNYNSIIGIGNP